MISCEIGIYVITGYSFFLMYGSLFRLSNFQEDDQWVKLQLGVHDFGRSFVPLRKVITV